MRKLGRKEVTDLLTVPLTRSQRLSECADTEGPISENKPPPKHSCWQPVEFLTQTHHHTFFTPWNHCNGSRSCWQRRLLRPGSVTHGISISSDPSAARGGHSPRLDLVLDLSMIACLLGLFNTERLASEMSAVTLVMDILLGESHRRPWGYEQNKKEHKYMPQTHPSMKYIWPYFQTRKS